MNMSHNKHLNIHVLTSRPTKGFNYRSSIVTTTGRYCSKRSIYYELLMHVRIERFRGNPLTESFPSEVFVPLPLSSTR